MQLLITAAAEGKPEASLGLKIELHFVNRCEHRAREDGVKAVRV